MKSLVWDPGLLTADGWFLDYINDITIPHRVLTFHKLLKVSFSQKWFDRVGEKETQWTVKSENMISP